MPAGATHADPKTEGDLIEFIWWWRHCRFAKPPEPVNATREYLPNDAEWRWWKDGMEQIAQEWELIRRFRPDLNWLPFYDLSGFVAQNLRVRLIQLRLRATRMITTTVSPAGWTDHDSHGWRWNLCCTKDALRRAFAAGFLPTEHEISQVLGGSLTVDDLIARRAKRRKESPSIAEFLRWIDSQAKGRAWNFRAI